MPIYEYVCKKCNKQFELLIQGSTAPVCPSCQSRQLEKQLSEFAPRVKDALPAKAAMPACGAGACPGAGGPGCGMNLG